MRIVTTVGTTAKVRKNPNFCAVSSCPEALLIASRNREITVISVNWAVCVSSHCQSIYAHCRTTASPLDLQTLLHALPELVLRLWIYLPNSSTEIAVFPYFLSHPQVAILFIPRLAQVRFFLLIWAIWAEMFSTRLPRLSQSKTNSKCSHWSWC